MIRGIVGAGKDKFSLVAAKAVKELIYLLVSDSRVTGVTSGHSPKGGVDIWAEETAERVHRPAFIFAPRIQNWEQGYKPRNIRIAIKCDELHNIVAESYPESFSGRRFNSCYHCADCSSEHIDRHVKSGGCWTMRYAQRHNKRAFLYIVTQEGKVTKREI